MGKPKIFVINLSENLVYFAGSKVEGTVLLELSEPQKTKGISIVLLGKAKVHWREETGTSGNATRRYYGTQSIFSDVFIQLWGNGRDSHELPAGRYGFPFKFQLPSDRVLPTSFECPIAYIRYSLLARIHRHWSWNLDHEIIRAITVNEIVDINTAQLAAPLSSSNEKTLCCLCCTSGPISLSAKTDRGGYCPGESIAVSLEAENHSNRRITSVQAALMQVVVCYVKGRSHVRNQLIQMIKGPGIEPGGTSNWSNELLPIPATVPSISSCYILNLSYVLTVTLDIPHVDDFHVAIPVTIGNVPFQARGRQSTSVSYRVSQNLPSVPTAPYAPPAAANPHPPGSPPGGAFNYSTAHPPVGLDNHTMEETQFAPAPPPSYAKAIAKVKGEVTLETCV